MKEGRREEGKNWREGICIIRTGKNQKYWCSNDNLYLMY